MLISFHAVALGLVVPLDTFCAINLISFAVNPLGVVKLDCKNGNSLPNLTKISEAPGKRLWSFPEIVV